jgi:hypothetical protein
MISGLMLPLTPSINDLMACRRDRRIFSDSESLSYAGAQAKERLLMPDEFAGEADGPRVGRALW